MSRTDTDVGGAVALTGHAPEPYVTRAPVCRPPRDSGPAHTGPVRSGRTHPVPSDTGPTGTGRPAGSAAPERAAGRPGPPDLADLADLAGDADRLAAELGDRLVGEALRGLDRYLETLLSEGAPAEAAVPRLPSASGRPALAHLAPSLEGLLRLVAATDGRTAPQLGEGGPGPEGGPRRPAGRGPARRDEEGSDPASYRRLAALVRPLARIAGPGDGLVLALPKRLLDEEFGVRRVLRFEDVDFPRALTHEPTRRFLRETGLPEDGSFFRLDTEVPLPALPDYYADERPDAFAADHLPVAAGRLIRLGRLAEHTSLVVDGATGTVLAWSESDLSLHPLNTDISTLAFTAWLLRRRRPSAGG
ncbi:SUKH-4 family immunity protein [Streptomyces sp. NPDC048566]|uniref:SUKH-4 family immunity protein n=1 Tax=Streptomyces sp. NPDC048566 TaxID=3365569 RepID=UPI00371C66C6